MGGTYQARKLKRLVPLSFYGKDRIKEIWSRMNQNLTSKHNSGFNLVAVEAAAKTSILVESIQALGDACTEPVNYGIKGKPRFKEFLPLRYFSWCNADEDNEKRKIQQVGSLLEYLTQSDNFPFADKTIYANWV